MALSIDLRKRILESYEQGEGSIRTLAKRFKIASSTVWELLRKYEQTKELRPESPPGRPSKLGKKEGRILEKLLEKRNDLTLREMRDRLEKLTGIRLGITRMHYICEEQGFRYKKNSHRIGAKSK
jgi:transposase